ncbi:DUF6544 family protein [Maritimibacter fusiformis]|uniref:Uncharacterized protein n=1 Tax=Maritimibacter fusiformis TaxID=2603819 RepID=A0A5D0RN20_9RHOB|nr:DUF6544 family protein [Maritimibacter fusiformis]TYB82539.1 hypothetical protein FVF75_07440 [Maritimibacter fusiformis]
MKIALYLVGFAVVALILAGALGHIRYRNNMASADAAWGAISDRAGPADLTFDPEALEDQPEIARRYLTHAIAPGTPLRPTVILTMDGTFRLGTQDDPREFEMHARQLLSAPDEFVWVARMDGGGMKISGTDGLEGGHGWTRFWAFGVKSLVNVAATEDIDRAARARPALEAIWAPAALHPALGARWQPIGPNRADVTFGEGADAVTITLTLDASGAVKSVVTQRWSNENPEGTYRLQPFGADVLDEHTFAGFTIPSKVSAGNHWGTPDFFPFFEVTIRDAFYAVPEPEEAPED